MNILENDCEEGRNLYGEANARNTFTCRICGKSEYRNGEFDTIKMGDIFTHITHFPSISTENSERDRLCSSCSRLNIHHLPSSPESSSTKIIANSNCTTTIMQNLNHSNHSSNNNLSIINNNNTNSNSRSSCSSNTSNILQSATPSPPILLHHTHSPNPPGSNSHTTNIQHHHSHPMTTMTHSPPAPPPQTSTTMYRDNNTTSSTNSMQPMSTINQPQRIHSNTQPTNISHTQNNPPIVNPPHPNLTVLTTVTNSTTEDPDTKYNPMTYFHHSHHPPVITHSNGNININKGPSDNPSINNPVVIKSEFPLIESPPVSLPPPPQQLSSSHNNPQQHAFDNTPPGNNNPPPHPPTGKECPVCNKSFKNPQIAQVHFQKVHGKVGKYVCEICGAVFSYRGSLDSHLAAHNPPVKTHDCPTCGQKFKEKSNLTQHMKTHLDIPKKFKCELCPSEFSKGVNLRYHIKRKHPSPAEGMNDTNGSTSNTPSEAKTDTTKLPDKDKPQGNFKCEHCGRCFLFKNNLKAHLRTHTRDKKYTCEICEKSFIYKESLKNHMLLHSNTLPYLCEICGKKFRDRSNRRKHVKNVHKYMFINSDGTAATNPPATTNGELSKNKNTTVTTSSPTKTPGKRKRNTKKSDPPPSDPLDINPGAKLPEEKSRGIIKSTPKAKKEKAKNANSSSSSKNNSNNKKSVIVSAASTISDRDLDRKIIMSPSPKSIGSSGDSHFAHSHALPLTVHVPLNSGSNLSPSQYNHGLSHGRNVIVKASSTISSNQQSANLSPSLDLYQQQQQHQQQRVSSHQQNVIVYPKPKMMSEPQPYPPSNSVISQNLQQQPQYYNHSNHHPSQQQPDSGGGYPPQGNYIPMPMTGLVSPPSSIPPQQQSSRPSSNSAFDYVLSTNTSSDRSNEITRYGGPPHASLAQNPSGEVPVVNVTNQYSHSAVYNPEAVSYQQEHPHPHSHPHHHHEHYWISSVDSSPPTSSSPYSVAAPPSETSGSSGPQQYGGPITAASNVLNAPTYTVLHSGQEVVDPSGNGTFFYKDFDFSFLGQD